MLNLAAAVLFDEFFLIGGERWRAAALAAASRYGVKLRRQAIAKHGTALSALTALARISRAREVRGAGAGGATRARGWRATAIRFQQLR